MVVCRHFLLHGWCMHFAVRSSRHQFVAHQSRIDFLRLHSSHHSFESGCMWVEVVLVVFGSLDCTALVHGRTVCFPPSQYHRTAAGQHDVFFAR